MINISGRVINQQGGGIPYASIELADDQLNGLGEGTTADSRGYFNFNADSSLPAYFLLVSSVGYRSVAISTDERLQGMSITLATNYRQEGEVIVTANRPKKFPWIIAGLLLLVMANKK